MSTNDSVGGIFVTEGATFALSDINIAIDDRGQLCLSTSGVGLGLDVCPMWLEIAYSHLLVAQAGSAYLSDAVRSKDSVAIAHALEQEFRAGVQTIVSACIALDAFYASVKPHSGVSGKTAKAWKKNLPRHAQIALTVCEAFNIKNSETVLVRGLLKELYELRGFAVHPSSVPLPPALHPEIGLVVDQRFTRFRFHNARVGLRNSISLIATLLSQCDGREWLKPIRSRLEKRVSNLKATWERQFGPVTERG